MAGYSSASWAKWFARNGCITKDTPPPFNLPSTTSGYTPLLEMCALFGTVLADEDGVYDPQDSNDRLLLGLKGTISEF